MFDWFTVKIGCSDDCDLCIPLIQVSTRLLVKEIIYVIVTLFFFCKLMLIQISNNIRLLNQVSIRLLMKILCSVF